PRFGHMTLTYGLPYKATVYSGLIVSPVYRSIAVGFGKSMQRWGAVSLDYRYSKAVQPRVVKKEERGGVFRLRHNKAFLDYSMSLTTMAQFYPKQHYRTFSEAVDQ